MPDDVASLPPLAHTMDSAARRVGLGRTKFYELVKNGRIRTFTVDKRRLVPESSLVEFVENELAARVTS
jgi:excisionase family DNA binding protein